jgi:hypothetical protein
MATARVPRIARICLGKRRPRCGCGWQWYWKRDGRRGRAARGGRVFAEATSPSWVASNMASERLWDLELAIELLGVGRDRVVAQAHEAPHLVVGQTLGDELEQFQRRAPVRRGPLTRGLGRAATAASHQVHRRIDGLSGGAAFEQLIDRRDHFGCRPSPWSRVAPGRAASIAPSTLRSSSHHRDHLAPRWRSTPSAAVDQADAVWPSGRPRSSRTTAGKPPRDRQCSTRSRLPTQSETSKGVARHDARQALACARVVLHDQHRDGATFIPVPLPTSYAIAPAAHGADPAARRYNVR